MTAAGVGPGPDTGSGAARVAYVITLGAVIIACIAAGVVLAVTGSAGQAGTFVGAIGAAAVGALAGRQH